jgi:hypothetical protein
MRSLIHLPHKAVCGSGAGFLHWQSHYIPVNVAQKSDSNHSGKLLAGSRPHVAAYVPLSVTDDELVRTILAAGSVTSASHPIQGDS